MRDLDVAAGSKTGIENSLSHNPCSAVLALLSTLLSCISNKKRVYTGKTQLGALYYVLLKPESWSYYFRYN